jgi:hypothetical protein
MARYTGMDYSDMLRAILKAAEKRLGIQPRARVEIPAASNAPPESALRVPSPE